MHGPQGSRGRTCQILLEPERGPRILHAEQGEVMDKDKEMNDLLRFGAFLDAVSGRGETDLFTEIEKLKHKLSAKRRAAAKFKKAWIRASKRAATEEKARIRLIDHIIKTTYDTNSCAACPCHKDCTSPQDMEYADCYLAIEKKVCIKDNKEAQMSK